jgi:hypothetical protein
MILEIEDVLLRGTFWGSVEQDWVANKRTGAGNWDKCKRYKSSERNNQAGSYWAMTL